MKSDIEIARENVMEPICDVASKINVDPDDLELYGKYKAFRYACTTNIQNHNRYIDNATIVFPLQKAEKQKSA